ncbi:hypothetical protein PHLGIDRAFT_425579 [Phlebiopsis gigantea 11061_1 CR5-6]|uniref:Uncharacterized protein n=1 Tax=Phlebiopsis gigantea (strain 11061_1 CR5-6) TaxID=745531 RepID=A0A0C3RYN9_PHLG1|nr:hypothetical protein PHLGIDRAFT_425579 [Phlebiopsis gigantea 11061_1 CR5-6]
MGLTQSAVGRSRRRSQRNSELDDLFVEIGRSEDRPLEKDSEKGSSIWDFTDPRLPAVINWVLKKLLKTLCLISFGHPSLHPVYDICLAPRTVWQESTDRLYDRLNTIVVVAGLLLSATGAFVTTIPPLPNILNYTERGPYLCLFVSWGLSLGTLIVGSAIMFVVSKCEPSWFQRTHMNSRSRIVCTMWLIGFPFISMGASTAMAAIGLLVAAWTSRDLLVVKGAVWLLLFPVSCIPVWIWTQYKPGEEEDVSSPDHGVGCSQTPSTAVPGGAQATFSREDTAIPIVVPQIPEHPVINLYVRVQPVVVPSQSSQQNTVTA